MTTPIAMVPRATSLFIPTVCDLRMITVAMDFATRCYTSAEPSSSPVPHRSIGKSRDRQARCLVRIRRGELLVDVDAMSRSFAAIEQSFLEAIIVWEYRVRFRGVPHVLLNTEVGHPCIEVKRGAHGHRREIRRPVATGADLVETGEVCDAAQMRDAAGTDDGATNVVDELILDQILGIPDRVEDLAHRERYHGVLPDQSEGFLVFGAGDILEPEQLIGLEQPAEISCFLRRI